jgi:hypothetical protein
MSVMSFKKEIKVTPELKFLRLLSSITGPVVILTLSSVEGFGVKKEDLFKMQKDGLILIERPINNISISITNEGTKKYEDSIE